MAPRKVKADSEVLDRFVEAYTKNACRFVSTCKELGMDQKTVKEWEGLFPAFHEKLQKSRDLLNEHVEGTLVKEAVNEQKPNMLAKIFYLKNNWRDKYGDRQTFEMEPSKLWFDSKKEIETEKPIELAEGTTLESSGNI